MIRYCITPIIIGGLAGCGQVDAANESSAIKALEARIEVAESQLSALSSDSVKILALEQDLSALRDRYATTDFDPTVKGGYGRIDTVAGNFLVSVGDVQPYLDGVRVRLSIGNIQSGTYNGFSLTAHYGLRYPSFPTFDTGATIEERHTAIVAWEAAREAQQKSVKEITAKESSALIPGRWNDIINRYISM